MTIVLLSELMHSKESMIEWLEFMDQNILGACRTLNVTNTLPLHRGPALGAKTSDEWKSYEILPNAFFYNKPVSILLEFKDENDAMIFKLKYGGEVIDLKE